MCTYIRVIIAFVPLIILAIFFIPLVGIAKQFIRSVGRSCATQVGLSVENDFVTLRGVVCYNAKVTIGIASLVCALLFYILSRVYPRLKLISKAGVISRQINENKLVVYCT